MITINFYIFFDWLDFTKRCIVPPAYRLADIICHYWPVTDVSITAAMLSISPDEPKPLGFCKSVKYPLSITYVSHKCLITTFMESLQNIFGWHIWILYFLTPYKQALKWLQEIFGAIETVSSDYWNNIGQGNQEFSHHLMPNCAVNALWVGLMDLIYHPL